VCCRDGRREGRKGEFFLFLHTAFLVPGGSLFNPCFPAYSLCEAARCKLHCALARDHLFKVCPEWKVQQKIGWPEVQKETGEEKPRFTVLDSSR